MDRRKTVYWIIGLVVLCLGSPLLAQEGANPGKLNFLWKVRAETATAYLLGSIHLLKPDMYPLDRKIEEAFGRSGVLVVETNVRDGAGEERQKRMLAGALYPGDDTSRNHLSQETYDLLRRRFPELSLDRLGRVKPSAPAMPIAVLEYQKMGVNYNHGIDVYFLDKASNGKRIRELERPVSASDTLNGFYTNNQDLFLQYTLLDLDQVRAKTDQIL